jgi:DNA-binding MarR family transcriptional regulator
VSCGYFGLGHTRVRTARSLSQLETELAVLARTLEGLSRRSEIHRERDRSSYLIARTLSADRGTSVSGLADRLALDATTVTRQVATMEAAGLAVRFSDPDDGRVRLVRLTPLGDRKMREVQRARGERIGVLLAEWPRDDQRDFAALLARFNQALLQRGNG